jgi:hypothetical protein
MSYGSSIHPDGSSREQLLLSARKWLDKEWNPSKIRPLASETLVKIATVSGALSDDDQALTKWLMSNSNNTSQK